ncbi:MAG: hypothetical protein RR472_05500, partial [Anaerovoracaceae bacterium]
KGKIKEIEQEDIAFYYINHETKKLDILAEKLYNQDGLFFSSTLSSYINEEDQFVCSYVKGKMGDRTTSILNKILATS